MAAVMLEVLVRLVSVRTPVGATMPAARASATVLPLAALARPAGTTTAQAGQRLRDGFGGIRLGVLRFGGHDLILHAT